MRLTGERDHASSQSIGLIVAAVVIAGGFVYAKNLVQEPASVDSRGTARANEATTALELLVHDPGATATGGAWTLDADHLERMGLAISGQSNFLDYQGITSLRNGTLASSANSAPDYPDVKAAIGIGDADFHLRTYPVLPTVDDPRWQKDTAGRLAYVGQYKTLTLTAPTKLTTSWVKNDNELNITVTVRNDGPLPGVFVVDFNLKHNGNLVHASSQEANTLLLAPGASQTVWASFNKLKSWHHDLKSVEVDITDPLGNAATDLNGTRVGPITINQVPPEDSHANTYGVYVSAADRYVIQGNAVKFAVYALDGKGDRPSTSTARFVLYGPDGKEWRNSTLTLNATTDYMVVCGNCTAAGTYTGVVWDSTMTWRKLDAVSVTPTQLFTEKSVPTENATSEINSLSGLVATFSTTRYNVTTNPDGDVYGDDLNGPADLAALMARYSTIIVGSEISQNSLTSASFRNAMRDWVKGGGNLVVLGTNTQVSSWLSDVYRAAQDNANGGISAPDITHPILVTPNALMYDRYVDRGRAWAIRSDQPFTHVLTRGLDGTDTEDTLAIANPGSLGNGSVVLTSYMPAQLTNPQDPKEETRFFQNLLSQRYNMLFMDYGPKIPDGVPVGSADRLVAIPHPNVPGAVVEVRLVMYVFG